MNALAQRAGFEVEYRFEGGWSDIIATVKLGAADVAPGMGESPDREQDLAFTEPIDAFPIAFFVRTEHRGIDVTPGTHTVGVVRGSVASTALKERQDVRQVPYESFVQGLFDLLAGKIEAFACPAPTLWQIARESRVESHIKVVDRPIAEITRAIAVRKGDDELLRRLDDAIVGLVGTTAYREINAKWYGKPVPWWTRGRIVAVGAACLLAIVALMAGWRYQSVLRLNRELGETIALLRQSEAALQQTAGELRSFLNAITESACVIDVDGRVLAANETLAQRFGRSVRDLAGTSIFAILPPEVAQRRRAHVDEVVRTGRPMRFEDERLGRVIDNSIYPVLGERGEVVALAIIGFDITERKRTENALQQSERRIRDIASALGEGIYVLDDRGEVTFMNPEAERLLGWSEAELRGRNIHDAVHPRRSEGTPLAFDECPMHTVVRTGLRYDSHDEIFVRRDGTTFPTSVISVPLREAGRIVASVTAFRDISAAKRAQLEREKLIGELQQALAEIKTLHGILPICSSCKKIRDDSGAWHQLEVYIRDRTDAEFTHGLCADCAARLYPRYYKGQGTPARGDGSAGGGEAPPG